MPTTKILRYWGAVDYKASLKFYDHVYKTGYKLHGTSDSKFPHWKTDGINLAMTDPVHHDKMTLTCRRVSFEGLTTGNAAENSFDAPVGRLIHILDKTIAEIVKTDAIRMGIKFVAFVDLDMPFDDLITQLKPHCTPDADIVIRLGSGEISDVALNYDYKRESGSAMLRVGPMTADEGRASLANVGNIKEFIAEPEEVERELASLYASLPKAFLMFDLDIFQKNEDDDENPTFTASDWPHFADEAMKHASDVLQGVIDVVMEK